MVFKPRPPKRRPRPTPRPPIPKPGRRPKPGPKGPLKPKPPGRKPKPGPKGPLKPRVIPEGLKKLFDDKRRPLKKLPSGKGILRRKK
tara:strand:- start:193 stop:453 length:261 start_codon:yes stop_codon:yes gene_type:complete